jgi:hypothetical protein
MPRLGNHDVRELARRLPRGFGFVAIDPQGRKVRRLDGRPLTVPNSPSSRRTIRALAKEFDRIADQYVGPSGPSRREQRGR